MSSMCELAKVSKLYLEDLEDHTDAACRTLSIKDDIRKTSSLGIMSGSSPSIS